MGILFFLLNVLKIIWILIVLLISVLLFIAFIPVNYDINCSKDKAVEAYAVFHCFFRQLYFKARYNGRKIDFIIKLFFWSNQNKKKKTKYKKALKEKIYKKEKTVGLSEEIRKEKTEEFLKTKAEGFKKAKKIGEDKQKSGDTYNDGIDSDIDDEKESIFDKIKMALAYDEKGELIRQTVLLIKRLIKDIKPDKFSVEGVIGFEDPSLVGYLLGLLGIIQAIVPFQINIKGNFEKNVLQGEIDVKGRFCLFFIVLHLGLYVFSKPVWKIIKKWKDG